MNKIFKASKHVNYNMTKIIVMIRLISKLKLWLNILINLNSNFKISIKF